jgi:DNA-binding CsgD family transcriptional regulator
MNVSKMNFRKLTKHMTVLHATILNLHEAGLPDTQIAKILDISRTTVVNVRKKYASLMSELKK